MLYKSILRDGLMALKESKTLLFMYLVLVSAFEKWSNEPRRDDYGRASGS